MSLYALRPRDDSYRQFLEEAEAEQALFNLPSIDSDWEVQSEESQRRVIFEAELKENQAFQTYGSRTQIRGTELHLLKPGDHIGWHRPYLIWHHAIVVETDVRNRKLLVIHYTKVDDKSGVAKQWINVDSEWGTLFRFDYSENITDENPPELVLARAEKKLCDKGYNILKNNCEHLATFCKTGREDSFQVHWAWGKVKETIHTTVVNGTKAVVKEVGKQTYRSMAESAGKVAAAETVEHIGRASNWAGAGLVAGLETIHCAYDVYHIYQNKKAGKIEERDFKVSVTQRISEGVLGTGLAIGGGILGEWVGGMIGGAIGSSVPVIGTIIGAFVGSVIGGAIGSIVGKALGSICGHWLGNLWWN